MKGNLTSVTNNKDVSPSDLKDFFLWTCDKEP